jgi:hypothetical protein
MKRKKTAMKKGMRQFAVRNTPAAAAPDIKKQPKILTFN